MEEFLCAFELYYRGSDILEKRRAFHVKEMRHLCVKHKCLKRMHFLEMCIHLCNVYVFRLLLICKEEKSITFEGTNVPVGKSNKYSTSDGLILKL